MGRAAPGVHRPGRRAVAARGCGRRVTASLGADDIVCFAGAQEALYAAMHALLSPGDHAIVVLPSYQSIETIAIGLCQVTGVALDAARGLVARYRCRRRRHPAARRASMAISFPNNPTGKQLEHGPFRHALVALCRRHGIWLVSDEVYRLRRSGTPAGRLPQAADAYERGLSFGVLSKAYGLPGLRIGWVACRDRGAAGPGGDYPPIPFDVQCRAERGAGLHRPQGGADRILGPQPRAGGGEPATSADGLLRVAIAPSFSTARRRTAGVVCYPRYKGAGRRGGVRRRHGGDAPACCCCPASVFRSELLPLPVDRFRIGFGRHEPRRRAWRRWSTRFADGFDKARLR